MTDIRTDTFVASLDLRSRWLQDRLTLDLGGTYSATSNDADTIDVWNLTSNMRIGYALPEMLSGHFQPSLALRGTYNHMTDRLAGTNHDDATIILVLATAMPFMY